MVCARRLWTVKFTTTEAATAHAPLCPHFLYNNSGGASVALSDFLRRGADMDEIVQPATPFASPSSPYWNGSWVIYVEKKSG
jgi:hypothetical protein